MVIQMDVIWIFAVPPPHASYIWQILRFFLRLFFSCELCLLLKRQRVVWQFSQEMFEKMWKF